MQQITNIALNTVFYSNTLLSQNCVSGSVHQSEQNNGDYKALDFWSNTDFIRLSLFCRRWLQIL